MEKNLLSPFSAAFARGEIFLMEGALGERLKRDYGLLPHPNVALAIHGITEGGRTTLKDLWTEYASIAHDHGLPFLATTPTRRAKGIAGPGLPPDKNYLWLCW